MEQAARDAVAVMDAVGVDKAHIVGLSMGSFASLQLGMGFPERCLSLVPSGCGHGAHPDAFEKSRQGFQASAARLQEIGMAAYAEEYAVGPWRKGFQLKDPKSWNEFKKQLAEHSVEGSARTLQGVQAGRPCLWDFAEPLSRIELPVMVVAGDQDRPTLLPSLFLLETLKRSSLCVVPRTGHTINLEEPAHFNRMLEQFFCSVEKDRY